LKSSSRKVVYSGIQPTSVPHIGNYFGAIELWKNIQNEIKRDNKVNKSNNNQMLISIVDLHALTTIKNKEILK
jgi:tryptophanyl-tRNA synthetase